MEKTGNVLITGGSGFIGGYVLRHLKGCGYHVVNYDIVSAEESGVTSIQGSILDPISVKAAISGADTVFHFAGFSNINLVRANPAECLELNIMGTVSMLEALRLKGRGHFIFASSVYVHNTHGHLYTTSKLASELICRNYSDLYGMSVTILRLGTVYGEKSRHEDVVSLFARQAAEGKPSFIYGSGKQRRRFIHGDDIAKACERLIEEGVRNKSFILAGRESVSIGELAGIVKKVCPDVEIRSEAKAEREDDYQGDIGDIEETYRILKWEPQIGIEEGVRKMISYFQAIKE